MEEKTSTISKTSLYGFISNVFLAIALQPDLVDFLPIDLREYVKGIAVLGTFVFRQMTFKNTPDASTVVKNTEDVKKLQETSETETKNKTKLEVYE